MADDNSGNAEGPSMIVKYWGVRGSIPAPMTSAEIKAKQVELLKALVSNGKIGELSYERLLNPDFVKTLFEGLPFSVTGTYGGNTSCVEIQAKNTPAIIVDAGTGLRDLGREYMKRKFSGAPYNLLLDPAWTDAETRNEIHMFLSHYHWDHIQGIPFFGPMFLPKNIGPNDYYGPIMHFYGKEDIIEEITDVLRRQQQFPTFPVQWDELDVRKEAHQLKRMFPKPIILGKTTVTYVELDHPDRSFAYRFDVAAASGNGTASYVYASDTEHREHPDAGLVKLAKGALVMYYDGQYSLEDYLGIRGSLTGMFPKTRWGHSTYKHGIATALEAGVQLLVLGHHDPVRDDIKIDLLFDEAKRCRDEMLTRPEHAGKSLEVMMAYEGLEHRL